MKHLILGLLLSGLVGIAVLAGMIAFSSPPETVSTEGPIDFAAAVDGSYEGLPESETFEARDGSTLPFRRYEPAGDDSDRLIILVHGSAWHGMQFHKMAGALAERGLGTVIVPDLRGHGVSPERRGDVDYVGQFEDDIADLIAAMGGERDFGEVILGGHSSGGGLVVRFAGSRHGALADRFVLMAPFLKYNAPTTRENSGGWASPATPRIIGLTILNGLGISAFNHLDVISFAMPRAVLDGPYGDTATTRYSYRLNTSFAPRADYEGDLRAMRQPFLLVAGSQDEAFHADRYEPVIASQTDSGDYAVLPGVNHIGVTMDATAIDLIADWISGPR